MKDSIDNKLALLASDYALRLKQARETISDQMAIGRVAEQAWIQDIGSRGGTDIQRCPRTGVDSQHGGQSRFDVIFNLGGTIIYVEVQATDYNTGHKPVQAQGQILGFAHSATGANARYYKIIGASRTISRWSVGSTLRRLESGDYSAASVFEF